jgi:hypothetical protein
MSDLSDLHGVYPTSLRWNAEAGVLSKAVFNPETGERGLEEIELGKPATFVLDLATRERGYGLIKVGLYEMTLTPVSEPAPDWPGDPEVKPALGCWLWSPQHGELRFETNAAIARQAMASVWERARFKPEALQGLQPVIRFEGRAPYPVKALGKTFQAPVIAIAGWVERDKIQGWAARPPTVAPPAALPLLGSASAPAASSVTPSIAPAQAKKGAQKGTKGKAKPALDDPPPFDDEIPFGS